MNVKFVYPGRAAVPGRGDARPGGPARLRPLALPKVTTVAPRPEPPEAGLPNPLTSADVP